MHDNDADRLNVYRKLLRACKETRERWLRSDDARATMIRERMKARKLGAKDA